MFDITKFLTENKITLSEAGCQGCGWNMDADREKYCKTCDPSGDREANRKKSDVKEGALNEAGSGKWEQLKSDLKNSIRNEQSHYKAFVKASNLSTAGMRKSLRKLMAAQKQSAQIVTQLENVLAAFEQSKLPRRPKVPNPRNRLEY